MRNHYLVAVALILGLGTISLASTISVDNPVLYTQGTLGLGSGVQVSGSMAANNNFSAGSNCVTGGIYTTGTAYVGDGGTVNGSMLANGTANCGTGVTLNGNWTGSSVSMGSGAKVTGNIYAGSGSFGIGSKSSVTGNIAGNGSVWIDNSTKVQGNVSAGVGQTVSKGNKVTITGTTSSHYTAYDTFAGVSSSDFIAPAHGNAGSGSLWIDRGSKTLTVGSYGSISTGSNTTLNFSSGTYTLAALILGGNNIVNIDTSAGSVVLNILGSFTTGGHTTFTTTGSGILTVNVFNANAYLNSYNEFTGNINVYGGTFQTGSNNQLTGYFGSTGAMYIGDNSTVVAGAVPEPAVMTLLFLGSVGLLARRRGKTSPIRIG